MYYVKRANFIEKNFHDILCGDISVVSVVHFIFSIQDSLFPYLKVHPQLEQLDTSSYQLDYIRDDISIELNFLKGML